MIRNKILSAALAASALTLAPTAALAASNGNQVQHVLLISIDGFHDFDLTNYIAAHPNSTLASLVARGVRYNNAFSTVPSDSFPATVGMFTGGSPSSTGIYYDDSYSRLLSPPNSDCSTRGTEVAWKENINFDSNSGSTVADINPAKLPRDPDNGCTPVYPHQNLKVNTIFEVAHAAGLRTAIADKHPSYEILNGPSGTGLDDFYGPEFNSAKKDMIKIIQNDELKVQAVLHEIDGFDHTGTNQVGVPALFGMNFQSVNIGQKFSGYADAAGTTPQDHVTLGKQVGTTAPGTAQAMDYVDGALGRFVAELAAQGLTDSTEIVLGTKHGNSPVDRSTLRTIDQTVVFPQIINAVQPGLMAQVTADTMALVWLNDQSKTDDAAAALQANANVDGAAMVISGDWVNYVFNSELSGNDDRRPDIVVLGQEGVVYTTPNSKLCDHGGAHVDDLHVALVVVNPAVNGGRSIDDVVSIRQIAPTVLRSLGLNPSRLDAVRLEHTHELPGANDNGFAYGR